ncbi:DMT family transporter [Streptomyces sp. BR1]|uniref:DMT family transporter n=1 Tax=Streptomyces sp. BR1 TaxID=1592323 RepID=UPI00402BABDB
MSALALSVLLSLISAVAYAAAAIVQERVAAATPDSTYLRQGAWWGSVALNGLGALLHVVALACGPLTLVQPLGALTIVFALPMAAVFVRRKAGAAAWRGAIMATAGLAGLLALTTDADADSVNGGQRLILAAATFAGMGALFLGSRAVHKPVLRSVLLAASAGVSFGMASVFTKVVAEDWNDGLKLSEVPSLLAIAVLAAAGLLISQASYRGAGLAAPLATVTVVNPVVAATVGLTLFGEEFRYGTAGLAIALASGVVAAGGLILLTTERMSTPARRSRTERQTTTAERGTLPGIPAPGQSAESGDGKSTGDQRLTPPALR